MAQEGWQGNQSGFALDKYWIQMMIMMFIWGRNGDLLYIYLLSKSRLYLWKSSDQKMQICAATL